jgi:hypothetical protein
VHHLTYAHLGHERDEDLQVLCVACHGRRHPSSAEQWRAQVEMVMENAAKSEAAEAEREARLEYEDEMRSLTAADWSGEGPEPPL